ncbi:MAG: hypothetical protein Q7W05_13020 [Deltaproteobacteria bacterium]|nr:hypothetical protein [Deltaproteobacteria bacterium]
MKKCFSLSLFIIMAFLLAACSRKTTHEKLQGDWIEAGDAQNTYKTILRVDGDSIGGVYFGQPDRPPALFYLNEDTIIYNGSGGNGKLIVDKITKDSLIFKNGGRFYNTNIYYDSTINLEKIMFFSGSWGDKYYFEASCESVFCYKRLSDTSWTYSFYSGVIDSLGFVWLQEKIRKSNILQTDSFYILRNAIDGGGYSTAIYYNGGKRKAVYVSNMKAPLSIVNLYYLIKKAPSLCRLNRLEYDRQKTNQILLNKQMEHLPCIYYNRSFLYQHYKKIF